MADLKQLAIFCHKMDQALRSGIDIRRALCMMQDEKNGSLQRALDRTCAGVESGRQVSSCMRADEAVYTTDLVNAVYIAEQTGHMEMAFARMADRFDAQETTRRQIRTAMIYPVIVLIVLIGAILAVAYVYHFLPQAIMLSVLILVGIAFIALLRKGGHELGQSSNSFGSFLIGVPFVGKCIIQSELADFATNMAIFYECGVPVEEGLRYSVASVHYEVLRRQIMRAIEWVKQGNPLSEALQMQGVFPADLIHMLKTGEASGNVEGMLQKISEYYRTEVTNRTQILMAILRQ